MSSDGVHRLVLSVDDFDDDEIHWILDRSIAPPHGRPSAHGPTVGLLFLTPSLRTRVGFAVAAHRLGGAAVDIVEQRWQPGITVPETFDDTLRTVSGMADVVVVRVPQELDRTAVTATAASPVINGGDGREHPTQALIDLVAIEAEAGPIGSLNVALCGDLGSRTANSMLRLLARFPPARLVLVAPDGREGTSRSLPSRLETLVERRPHLDPAGIDVLSMIGLPEGAGTGRLGEDGRRPFTLTDDVLSRLPASAVILSPMPIIDEFGPAARVDPRARHFAQSDRAVAVRAAVLDLISGSAR